MVHKSLSLIAMLVCIGTIILLTSCPEGLDPGGGYNVWLVNKSQNDTIAFSVYQESRFIYDTTLVKIVNMDDILPYYIPPNDSALYFSFNNVKNFPSFGRAVFVFNKQAFENFTWQEILDQQIGFKVYYFKTYQEIVDANFRIVYE